MKRILEDFPEHMRQDVVDTHFSDANKRAECVHGNRKRSILSILRSASTSNSMNLEEPCTPHSNTHFRRMERNVKMC